MSRFRQHMEQPGESDDRPPGELWRPSGLLQAGGSSRSTAARTTRPGRRNPIRGGSCSTGRGKGNSREPLPDPLCTRGQPADRGQRPLQARQRPAGRPSPSATRRGSACIRLELGGQRGVPAGTALADLPIGRCADDLDGPRARPRVRRHFVYVAVPRPEPRPVPPLVLDGELWEPRQGEPSLPAQQVRRVVVRNAPFGANPHRDRSTPTTLRTSPRSGTRAAARRSGCRAEATEH